MIPIFLKSDMAFVRGIQQRATQLTKNYYKIYHLKCAKALFASAILCVSSRFFTAEPSLLEAAIISAASLAAIVLSLLAFA